MLYESNGLMRFVFLYPLSILIKKQAAPREHKAAVPDEADLFMLPFVLHEILTSGKIPISPSFLVDLTLDLVHSLLI